MSVVSEWESKDVGDWIVALGLGKYRESFVREEIDGHRLLSIAAHPTDAHRRSLRVTRDDWTVLRKELKLLVGLSNLPGCSAPHVEDETTSTSERETGHDEEEDKERLGSKRSSARRRFLSLLSEDRQRRMVSNFFAKPHTVTVLLTCLSVMVSQAFVSEGTFTTAENVKRGLIWSFLVFLLYSMLQPKESLFFRPHPVFWRCVTGIHVTYLCVLVFGLFQDAMDVRKLMLPHLYPNLGVELEERSYAADCRVYTPEKEHPFQNIRDAIFDVFVIAHLLGWWAKAIMFRDVALCWVVSIGFEAMEQTFKHWLPNFAECWWDQIIMDLLVCNGLGIIIGLYTCRYFEMKKYHWTGVSTIKTAKGKVLRVLAQFTPYEWTTYDWDILSSPRRFLATGFLVVMVLIVELNCFFLKYVLWVPPNNMMNVYRVSLWFLFGNAAFREYYQFVTDPTVKRIGPACWLALSTALVEALICIKFGRDVPEFRTPWPRAVVVFWSIALFLFTSLFVWYFYRHTIMSAVTRILQPLLRSAPKSDPTAKEEKCG